MSLPQPLMFTVGLIDQITKPIAKISHAFNGLAADYQRGTMQMASGIGGIAASALGIHQALMPAIEMDRALGEVKSLGVRESALKSLAGTSYDFALQYGKSATDFVRSSYDIQSAIAGLNDADLSRFTLASNVLAVAPKPTLPPSPATWAPCTASLKTMRWQWGRATGWNRSPA